MLLLYMYTVQYQTGESERERQTTARLTDTEVPQGKEGGNPGGDEPLLVTLNVAQEARP